MKKGRPKNGTERTRNQIKVILPKSDMIKLLSTAENQHKSISALILEILLDNIFEGHRPSKGEKIELDSVQVTINAAVYKKLEDIALDLDMSCTNLLAYYVNRRLKNEK